MIPYVGWGVPLFALVAGLEELCDAFAVSPRWVPAPSAAHGIRHLSGTTPLRTRFLTTARGATAADGSDQEDDDDVLVGDVTPPQPPPDDYYPGEIGYQRTRKSADGTEVDKFTDYPINLPSYLLLCLATVSSIAFTGSIFEVIGKHPQLGFTATYIIGTLALPTFIFLFYAAIKKGQAEVEEDDAKYDGPW